jgi:hypothetical protein
MGKGENGMNASEEAEQLEHKVDTLREDLDGLVGELDRRRHALGRQLKPIALIAAGVAAAVGIGLALWFRHRRRTRPKLAPFAEALRRMRAHPEQVANASPSIAKKTAAAALTTLASLAVRRAFTAAVPERSRKE